jgi:hypothetical protein
VAHKLVPNYADDGIARKTSPELTPTPATSAPSTRAQPTQQQRAFSYSNMQIDDPVLYQKYMKGRSQVKAGGTCLLSGAVSAIGGIVDLSEDSGSTIGTIGAVIGGISITVGIIGMISGGVKKRSAKKEYRRRYSDTSGKDAPYFQLNAHQNGLGLAYVF